MENTHLKYFLYARRSIEKSDKEDRVASIEDQIREMTQISEKYNLKIVKTFFETKTGSKVGVRDEFNEMMKQIKSGKANAILTWKLNRLARNFVEGGQIIEMLQRGVIKEIRTYEKSYFPSDNVLTIAVELGMSNQYSRDLAIDIKRGLMGRVQSGFRPSIAPLGYKNSKYHEKGKEEILVDEERFPIVRKIFDLMLTGIHSPLALTKMANEELHLTMRYGSKVSKALDFAAVACDEFKVAMESKDLMKKRAILAAIGYNHLIFDKNLILQPIKQFLVLEKLTDVSSSVLDRLEPTKNLMPQGHNGQNTDANSLLWT